MTEQQTAILKEAIETYGMLSQIDMLHEEMGELMQAISKAKRSNMISNDGIRTPATLNVKRSLLYHQLCSEVADVKIMLAQLEMELDAATVQCNVDRKIDRLAKRLKIAK